MPHQTFFNLPAEKQQRILDVSIKEFAEKTYHKASISNIVKESSIAKGSFYQYFDDKKDLFKYILEHMGHLKLQYFSEIIPKMNEMDFFDLLKGFYVGGVAFAKEHPDLTRIGNFILKTDDEALKNDLMSDSNQQADQFMNSLIQGAIDRGEVRDDIDINFINHMVQSMSLSAIEYYYKTRSSLEDVDDDFVSMTHTMVDCLKEGLMKR